ncbi:MAG: hemerythrin domain-containing protein [Terriglobales bacterium]
MSERRDWKTAPLPELMTHIVEAHHAFCRREMARLNGLFPAAAGEGKLAAAFQQLCAALSQHLAKEEMVLFPLIAGFAAAQREHTRPPQPSFGSVANPIRMMVLEHGEAEKLLAQMRVESNGFAAPARATEAVQQLYAGLRAFDEDMTVHVQLEDTALFPRAIALEQELLGG